MADLLPTSTETPEAASISSPKSFDWSAFLKEVAKTSGGSYNKTPFGQVGPTVQAMPQQGVPLFSMPTPQQPMQDEQQKQTTQGDVEQYAKIFAMLFG